VHVGQPDETYASAVASLKHTIFRTPCPHPTHHHHFFEYRLVVFEEISIEAKVVIRYTPIRDEGVICSNKEAHSRGSISMVTPQLT
jgi:hypothetical protein